MSKSIVGIDIGYGDIKIVSDDLLSVEDSGCLVSFPTLIARARGGAFVVKGQEPIHTIEVGGKNYCVGKDAMQSSNVLTTRYETWFKEDVYLAFYKKALSHVAPGVIDVVTGLPVSAYNQWHGELKNRLTGEFVVNGKTYRVDNVTVMPQPFGSFSNFVLDANGEQANDDAMQETIGIIDIGNRTTDFILVESGTWKEEGASGTINTGVSDMLGQISKRVLETYNVDLTPLQIREAIRSRTIKAFGKPKDIGAIIDKEADFFATNIEHTARTFWGTGGNVDTVLLVGGGAEIFKKSMENLFPHLTVPKDPAFSNAKGFWKYGVATR